MTIRPWRESRNSLTSRLRCAGSLSQTTNSGVFKYPRRWVRKVTVSSLPTALSKIWT